MAASLDNAWSNDRRQREYTGEPVRERSQIAEGAENPEFIGCRRELPGGAREKAIGDLITFSGMHAAVLDIARSPLISRSQRLLKPVANDLEHLVTFALPV